MPDYSRPGEAIHITQSARFTDSGRLTIEWAQTWDGGNAVSHGFFRYRLTSASTYDVTLVDYEPKQMPSVFGNPGTSGQCRFEFELDFVVVIACTGNNVTRWTRHP